MDSPRRAIWARASRAASRSAFLNDDTRPHPRWLSRLAAALRARGDAGLAASLIVGFGGETIDSAGDGYLTLRRRVQARSWRARARGGDRRHDDRRAANRRNVRRLRRGLHYSADAVRSARRFRRRCMKWCTRTSIVCIAPGSAARAVSSCPMRSSSTRGSASLGVLSARAVYLGQRNLELDVSEEHAGLATVADARVRPVWRPGRRPGSATPSAVTADVPEGQGGGRRRSAGDPAQAARGPGRRRRVHSIAALMDRDWVLRKYRERTLHPRTPRRGRGAAGHGGSAAVRPGAAPPIAPRPPSSATREDAHALDLRAPQPARRLRPSRVGLTCQQRTRYVSELMAALPRVAPGIELIAIEAAASLPTESLPFLHRTTPCGAGGAARRLPRAGLYGAAVGRTSAWCSPFTTSATHAIPSGIRLPPRSLRRAFYRAAARAADASSRTRISARRDLAAYGIAAERIRVVPLGVSDAFRPAADRAASRSSALPSPAPTVLHVGDLHPRRNVGVLIDAVAWLRAHHPALPRSR